MRISKIHAGLLGAVMIAGAGAAQSQAATRKPVKVKPVCDLVTDVSGDATGFIEAGVLPNDPGLDITSADIATNATQLTAVVRVTKLSDTTLAPTGETFYVNFTVGGKSLYIHGDDSPTGGIAGGIGFTQTTRSELPGVVKVTYDDAKSEVRMTTLLSNFKSKVVIKNGMLISAIGALSQRMIGTPVVSLTPTADTADGGDNYIAGTPSCVTVGS